MGECAICKKPSSETHHINEQHKADKRGFFEDTGNHKNKQYNLIAVCEECHNNIHKGKLEIEGFRQTTEGVKLKTKK
jgi:DNA mismatch repair protein MutS